jgi:peptidoglycan/xylan/chitin deacetylase (PgdA/CDA1 family)
MKGIPAYQKVLYKLFYFFRLTNFARFWNRSNVMILCYHGITERPDPDPDDRSQIWVARVLFRAHMLHLMRHYRVIPLGDYVKTRQTGANVPRHSVILTFDDGLRNFLTVAAPVLNEFRLPATLFLVTDFVQKRSESILDSRWTPADDRVSLSWSEARALASSQGIEMGSHTCSHRVLSELPSTEMQRELRSSLCAMREGLGQGLEPYLAYPYGAYSETVIETASESGYLCALTTDAGANSNNTGLLRLRRSVVRRFDTIEIFAARVSGLVGWLRIGRDTLLRRYRIMTPWHSLFPRKRMGRNRERNVMSH